MKKNIYKNKYWKNLPEELRLMCLAEVRGCGHYCTKPVLKYLLDHMNDCDTYIMETTPYEVLCWIDTSVEMCLFPLEQHEDDWIANTEDIRKVLERSEELVIKVAPADYREGHRIPQDSRYGLNIIDYAQKLDVYFSVLHMYTEEWEELKSRLEQLLSDTEQNVCYMLSCEDAEKYAVEDAWAECHYPGTDAWEPLNWLCREFIPGGSARKIFTQVYEKYAIFLHKLYIGSRHSKALMQLTVNAEKNLKYTCELILDEIEDSLEDPEGDVQSLMADKEQYESMIQKSEERADVHNKGIVCSFEETGNKASELYYHRKCQSFTRKLRAGMPEADEKLRKHCLDAAEAKYGVPLPTAVHERLKQELSAIEISGHASQYLIGEMIAEQSLRAGYPVSTRGMLGSSLVANLSGLTSVNPLPAHYWCPRCHYFESAEGVNYKTMGYDLPEKTCPECGHSLNAEGANIEPEILMGVKLDREPDIIFNVAAEVRPKLVGFLKDTFGEDCVFRAGVKAVLENGSIRRNVHPGGVFIIPEGSDIWEITDIRDKIPEDDFGMLVTERDYHELDGILKKYDLLAIPELSMLAELERRTGVSAAQIKTNDKAILNMLWQEGFSFLPGRNDNRNDGEHLEDAVIRELKPCCFSDFVRVTAMMHGVQVWKDNAELLLRSGHELSDCISTRDDIMQELLSVGMEKAWAYEIMNHVRKGHGLTKEMERNLNLAGVPDWYIKSCGKIVYLFPKAHAVEYALLYWRLAYYRLYFPEEYAKALAATQEKP